MAAKLKQEAEEKEGKAEQRRLDLIKQAGIEYLKKELGKGEPPMSNAFKEKLGKACKRHGFMEQGLHKLTCKFHFMHLQSVLDRLQQDRASMEKQRQPQRSHSRQWAAICYHKAFAQTGGD